MYLIIMSLQLYDACKLVCSDIGMNTNSEIYFSYLQSLCVNETLSKFTCDVIRVNWDFLWKEFIVNFVSGEYCKIFN